MYDFMLSTEERQLKKEARRFVLKSVSSDFLRKMDKDEIVYPREFVERLAEKGLLGVRFPEKYGGQGMNWVAEVAAIEEIGCLGMALGAGDSGHPYAVIAVSRGLSQMSAYELSFSVVVLVLAAGLRTLSIEDIVVAQQNGMLSWNVFRYPFATIAALITFLPMQMAYPFSIVLAPQEIPIGPPTEYSGRFLSFMFSGRALFGVAKLVLFVNLFFGGASSWPVLLLKTFLLYMFPVFVSAVFPRFRTEQSVRFLWFVPTALAAVDLVRVML